MKAVVITKPGGVKVLKVQERPIPALASGEILIRVEAAGVNRPDVAQRRGNYAPPSWAPQDIPGLEVAGVVAEAKDCKRYKPGDKVCALLAGGGYAEYVAVPEIQCLPVPDNLTMIEAASLPETYFTVWTNVFDREHISKGESFLVHGGTSGIGVAAIQLVKAWGCTVYATAGSEEKAKFCEKLGATKGINYREQDFVDAINGLTGNRGVDCVLDMIGGTYTQRNIDVLAEEGRLCLINFMGGVESKINLSNILSKRLTITGSTLRHRDPEFKANIAAKLEQHVWPWLISGAVKPIVYQVFDFAHAPEAHKSIESETHVGKIVLTVG
jgi:NADPH2:quinone reductase